jgi:hypothetical protein
VYEAEYKGACVGNLCWVFMEWVLARVLARARSSHSSGLSFTRLLSGAHFAIFMLQACYVNSIICIYMYTLLYVLVKVLGCCFRSRCCCPVHYQNGKSRIRTYVVLNKYNLASCATSHLAIPSSVSGLHGKDRVFALQSCLIPEIIQGRGSRNCSILHMSHGRAS